MVRGRHVRRARRSTVRWARPRRARRPARAAPRPGPTVAALLAEWDESRRELQRARGPLGARRRRSSSPRSGRCRRSSRPGSSSRRARTTAAPRRADERRPRTGIHHELTDEERAAALASLDVRARDGTPYVVRRRARTRVCGADDDIVLPAAVEKPDWELELAAVIGRSRAQRPARSTRSRSSPATRSATTSRRATTSSGRTSRASAPTGSPARTGRPSSRSARTSSRPTTSATRWTCRITLRLNGDVMQDSSTSRHDVRHRAAGRARRRRSPSSGRATCS